MAELSELIVKISSKFDDDGLKKGQEQVGLFQQVMSKVVITSGDLYSAMSKVVTTIVDMGKKAVEEAANSETVNLRLADAMQRRNRFTQEGFDHLTKYASQLQTVTKYTDEDIKEVQSQLINYGAHGEMLDKLTQATMDFATAKKIDLVIAGTLLAKTIGGENDALSRYGININGAKESTERMQSAVSGITRLFGGSAQSEANTFAGRMFILNNRISEIFETVGTQFLPILETMINVITEAVLPTFEKWAGLFKTNSSTLRIFETALRGLIISIATVAAVFYTAYNVVVNGIAALGLVLTGNFRAAKEALADIVDKSVTAGKILADIAINAVDVAKTAEEKKTALIQEHSDLREQISNKLSDKEISLQQKLLESQIATGEISLADQVTMWTELVNLSTDGTDKQIELMAKLAEAVTALQNTTFVGGWTKALQEVINSTQTWKDAWVSIIGGIKGDIIRGFQDMYINGVDTWAKLGNAVGSIGVAIRDTFITTIIGKMVDSIINLGLVWVKQHGLMAIATTSLSAVMTVLNAIMLLNPVILIATAIILGLKAISDNQDVIKRELAKAWDDLGKVFTKAWDDLRQVFAKAWEDLKNALSINPSGGGTLGSWENFREDVGDWIYHRTHATGGTFLNPSMGIIGEAGPEVVLPLNSPITGQLLTQAVNNSESNFNSNSGNNYFTFNLPESSLYSRRQEKESANRIATYIVDKIKIRRKI